MEAIIFVGLPGAGKSTFYKDRFFTSHLRINLDMLRTRHRERTILDACLRARQRFVVDNTNSTLEERARYIGPARAAGFALTAYYFAVPPAICVARNAARGTRERIPVSGIFSMHKKFQAPTLAEGFDRIWIVRLDETGGFLVEEQIDGSAVTHD